MLIEKRPYRFRGTVFPYSSRAWSIDRSCSLGIRRSDRHEACDELGRCAKAFRRRLSLDSLGNRATRLTIPEFRCARP